MIHKKVTFNKYVKVHHIIAWDFAYRKSRGGALEWVVDKVRFQRRAFNVEQMLMRCGVLGGKGRRYDEVGRGDHTSEGVA